MERNHLIFARKRREEEKRFKHNGGKLLSLPCWGCRDPEFGTFPLVHHDREWKDIGSDSKNAGKISINRRKDVLKQMHGADPERYNAAMTAFVDKADSLRFYVCKRWIVEGSRPLACHSFEHIEAEGSLDEEDEEPSKKKNRSSKSTAAAAAAAVVTTTSTTTGAVGGGRSAGRSYRDDLDDTTDEDEDEDEDGRDDGNDEERLRRYQERYYQLKDEERPLVAEYHGALHNLNSSKARLAAVTSHLDALKHEKEMLEQSLRLVNEKITAAESDVSEAKIEESVCQNQFVNLMPQLQMKRAEVTEAAKLGGIEEGKTDLFQDGHPLANFVSDTVPSESSIRHTQQQPHQHSQLPYYHQTLQQPTTPLDSTDSPSPINRLPVASPPPTATASTTMTRAVDYHFGGAEFHPAAAAVPYHQQKHQPQGTHSPYEMSGGSSPLASSPSPKSFTAAGGSRVGGGIAAAQPPASGLRGAGKPSHRPVQSGIRRPKKLSKLGSMLYAAANRPAKSVGSSQTRPPC